MTSILVQVNNEDEISLLKSVLERMNFSFKTITGEFVNVSPEEIQSVNKGIDEANQGLLKDSKEIHQAARTLCLE